MNLLRIAFNRFRGKHPIPPSRPVPPEVFATAEDIARRNVDVALTKAAAARRAKEEAERRAKEETERRAKLAAEGESSVPRPEESPRSSMRFSVASDTRYSITGSNAAFEAVRLALVTLDPRAFSRQIMAWVNERFDGNPVPFYTAAGLSRSAYSKLISHPERHPAKDTVLAMAAAFQFSLPEAQSFLALAGYALSDAIPSDIVWQTCFRVGIHHLPQIRELLARYASPSSRAAPR